MSDSSAEEDDLDLVESSPSPSVSSASIDDPYAFFDDDIDDYHPSEPTDRLSTLSDPILSHILSFLPTTKDAIKTSSLSKKFQFTWTFSKTLTFCRDPQTQFDIHSFISSVDQTLILHNSPKLDKFQLRTDYCNHFRSSINRWITFALKRDVEEIDLDLLGNLAIFAYDGDDAFFELPISLCSYDRLVKLSLTCVRFGDRSKEICWNSLKCLSLGYMVLDDALIIDILAGCRALDDLVIRECTGFNRLDIFSEGLKRLRIYGYGDLFLSGIELEIFGPWLRTLEIYGPFSRKIKIIDMKSLVDCTLNFWFLNKVSDVNADKDYIAELWGKVCKVKNLTFGNQFIEVLLDLGWGRMPVPALETRCLTLETSVDKCSLPAILHMMVRSSHLEKLVINIQTSDSSQTCCKFLSEVYSLLGESFLGFQSPCLRNSLRSVEITGFSGNEYETAFAERVLKHGRLLEKMVLLCSKTTESSESAKEEELLLIVRKMLSFKRASPKAVVLFSW